MKKFLYIFIVFKVISKDYFIYWNCESSKGCKEEDYLLMGCIYEEYAFKLNPEIYTKLGGQITNYFCDNYISHTENFTIQKCSPSERRDCSFLKYFNGKGIIRSIKECYLDGTINHNNYAYFSHFLISNYKELKELIDFDIPPELSN